MELFEIFGPFATKYRTRADIEWIQRLVGRDIDIGWQESPTYVQH